VEIAVFVLIIVLLVIFTAIWFLLSDLFLRRWEGEESELERRKKDLLKKQSLVQPKHCPFCGEDIQDSSSDYAQCAKCGRRVTTKR